MNRCWARLGASSLAIASLATPALSQDIPALAPVQAQPEGKWRVEYADWKCLLHRDFSSAGKAIVFSLSLPPLTPVASIKIAIAGDRGKQEDGKAVMFLDGKRLPGTLHYNVYGASNSVKPYRIREFFLHLDRHSPGSARERIRFWTKRHGDVEVQVSGFQPAWAALYKCMDHLYRELGIDQAAVAQMTTEPKGDIHSFIKLPNEPNLDFAFLYWVSAEGRVDSCRLLQPSGNKAFDGSLCSDLKAKARLKPATNAAGEPIRVPRFENLSIRTMVTFESFSM